MLLDLAYNGGMTKARKPFLKEWREFRGLSQQALADKIGISKGYLSQIENGKRPPGRQLPSIAKFLDIDPHQLFIDPPGDLAGPCPESVRKLGYLSPEKAAHLDPDLMAECISQAVRIIVNSRDLSDNDHKKSAADDAAAAALRNYFSLINLLNGENGNAA